MSVEYKNSNYSDYDEETFEDESIDEVSDEESIPEISDSSQSESDDDEEAEQEDDSSTNDQRIKSLTSSIDKLSFKDDKEDDNKEQNIEDANEDLSSLYSDEDDAAIIETLQQQQELEEQVQSKISLENNGHVIEESDSDEMSEDQIAQTIEIIKKSQTVQDLQDTIRSRNDVGKCSARTNTFSSAGTRSVVDLRVTSQTPSNFDSDSAFHMDIIPKQSRSSASFQLKSRTSSRKNLSFSNERLREIERHNQILLQKILTQKPRKGNLVNQNTHTTSSAINRRKQQRQIDQDNQVLKKKIEAISMRRPQALYR